MNDVIEDAIRKAQKIHKCDSCRGVILPGCTYSRYKVKYDGNITTSKEHMSCLRVSRALAKHLPDDVLQMEGMPRVCDMEPEEIETVRAEDPEAAAEVWPV